MSRIRGYLFLISLMIAAVPCFAQPVTVGVYPFPVAELKERISEWLEGEGIRIVRELRDDEGLSLECRNGRQLFLVRIAPRSPTASIVHMESLTGDDDAAATGAALRDFLTVRAVDGLDELGHELPAVPPGVYENDGAVFCLRASVRGTPVGFSGFAVDRRGFIISTAHDLDGIRWVKVGLKNGLQIYGKVVKRDVTRDLSLIRVQSSLAGAVPLETGRQSLQVGERIFMLSCAGTGRNKVRAGSIGVKPALVKGQPLWQVTLEVAPGDSGSPVFDSEGRLAGMVKGRYRGTGSRGFLIPVDTILDFLGKDLR